MSSPVDETNTLSPSKTQANGGSTSSNGGSSGGGGNNKGGRKSASLPVETVEYLKAWMMSPEHVAHPYPTEQEKAQIMAETGIELKQLTNWFVNNRKRYWKPRVEAKLQHKYADVTDVTSFGGAVTTVSTVANATNSMATNAASVPLVPIPSSSESTLSSSIGLVNSGLSISLDVSKPSAQSGASFLPSNLTNLLPLNLPAMPDMLRSDSAQQQVPSSPHGYVPIQNQPLQDNDGNVVDAVDGLAAFHRVIHVEDPHTISEGSGSSACNSDDESIDANSFSMGSRRSSTTSKVGGGTLRREEVDVHVVRPESLGNEESFLPTIRDLTIKTSVPKERIVATFPKCQIIYTVPFDIENDRKKVQTRRDGEVLRVKKHYLRLFLATRGVHSVPSPFGESQVDANISTAPSQTLENGVVSTDAADTTFSYANTVSPIAPECTTQPNGLFEANLPRVRSFTCANLNNGEEWEKEQPVRKRARTASGNKKGEDEWRELCSNAKSLFCESLPGLEEAAVMFGYSRG